MRLNLRLEEYNIQMPIGDLYNYFREYQMQCQNLEALGRWIKEQMFQAKDMFSTANYMRAEEAADSFLRKLAAMRQDLDELMQSCHQLAEKMEFIERPW